VCISFEIDGTVGEDKYLEDFSLGCFLYEKIYIGEINLGRIEMLSP
jgi:hypothetical protein